jgi:hypothetical protein
MRATNDIPRGSTFSYWSHGKLCRNTEGHFYEHGNNKEQIQAWIRALATNTSAVHTMPKLNEDATAVELASVR